MNLKLAEMYRRFADGMIPIDTQWDPEKLRQANRVVGFSLAMLIWVPIFAVIYFALGGSLASVRKFGQSAAPINVGVLIGTGPLS